MASNRSRSNSNTVQRGNSPNVHRQAPRQRPRRGSNAANPSFRTPATPSPSQNATPRTSVSASHHTDDVSLPEHSTHEVGMSSASRYHTNLRVLRRHDPHISSIFDQFAHVTLYYQESEDKYERGGYEGAMFFFERDIEPKYGFFILNRQGMHDYIRYLWPDDVVEPIGELVWISTVDHSKPSIMNDHDKTAGIWAMPMDVRESLAPMMARLMACIKDGVPYPEEYRYGPDRIPPQQICPEDMDMSNDPFWTENAMEKHKRGVATSVLEAKALEKIPHPLQVPEITQAPAQPQQTFSSVDQLLSRLSSSSLPAQTNPVPPLESQPLTGMALLNTMFASVSSPSTHKAYSHTPQKVIAPRSQVQNSVYPYPQSSTYVQTNGQYVPSQPQPHHQPQSQPQQLQKLTLEQLGFATAVSSPPEDMEILSPKPSAAGLPQILTADVIHELMGLPRSSSRTSIAATNASASPSSSRAQGERERERVERGYFADRGEDSGGISESSTGAEPISAGAKSNTAANEIVGRLAVGARPPFLSAAGSNGSMKGDVTPRARAEPLRVASPLQTGAGRPPTVGASGRVSADLGNNTSVSSTQTPPAPAAGSAPVALSAFQSDADLWPGSTGSIPSPSTGQDGKVQAGASVDSDEQEDVVEVNFSEISKLGDMRNFDAKSGSRTRRGKKKGKEADRQEETRKEPEIVRANGIVNGMGVQAAKAPIRGSAEEPEIEHTGAGSGMTSKKMNGVVRAVSDTVRPVADVRAEVVGASLRLALLSSSLVSTTAGASAVPLDRNSFMREVLTLIHTDTSFVDRMYNSYTELLNSTGVESK